MPLAGSGGDSTLHSRPSAEAADSPGTRAAPGGHRERAAAATRELGWQPGSPGGRCHEPGLSRPRTQAGARGGERPGDPARGRLALSLATPLPSFTLTLWH